MRAWTATLTLVLGFIAGSATAWAAEGLLSDFGRSAGDWEVIAEGGSPHAPDLRPVTARDGSSRTAAKLPLDFPGEAGMRRAHAMDWTGCDRLSFDVLLPKDAPRDVQAIAYVRDADLNWYQSLRAQPLLPGVWTTVAFDISDTSDQWVFKGHFRPWGGYVKQELQEVGLKLISGYGFTGEAFIDNVRVVPASQRPAEPAPPEVINLRANVASPGRFEKYEITFDIPKTYKNPFDPREVDIEGTFVAPSGEVTIVPAFYYQSYIRSVQGRTERLTPLGGSQWKIRFTPKEVGSYRYFIDLTDGSRVQTTQRPFEVVPSKNPGFVRISRKDPNYFEFDNGDFFYPIGQNICAPFDVRNAEKLGIDLALDEGTFAYDRYLNGMVRGRETLGRVWMAFWALGIEWSRTEYTHFRGLGRYSMQNAWRLDHILDFAERNGIALMITFDPHGHWNMSVDSDWKRSPYNVHNGGIIQRPEELFSDPEATRLYEQRVRYIMARWGYSPAVFSWEIFNEIDLAKEYYNPGNPRMIQCVMDWERDLARHIRRVDQGRHMVTTNRYNWRDAERLWQMPEIAYTSAHIFKAMPIGRFEAAWTFMSRFGKAFLVTESASDVWGGSPRETEDFMHAALWSSHMMPFAAPAMPWWWTFIDERDLYFHFKALSSFAAGEDRRGRNLRMGEAQVTHSGGAEADGLGVRCLQNENAAYCWIYDNSLMDERQKTRPLDSSLSLTVNALTDGNYRIEFWDTYKGVPTEAREAHSAGGTLMCPVPQMYRDVACKVKKVQ